MHRNRITDVSNGVGIEIEITDVSNGVSIEIELLMSAMV